jgi:hypothetical protein
MKKISVISSCSSILLAFAIWVPYVGAYESYNDPDTHSDGFCSSLSCHPGFIDGPSDVTHAVHTGGDNPITENCTLCHTDSDDDNPMTSWSSYNENNGYGCSGCHGRDYGENIGRNFCNYPIDDKPKASAWGLRRVHERKGVTSCFNCHGDMDPLPENVSPPYYVDSDAGVNLMDSCSDGLDNDGDGLYDSIDSDCGALLNAHAVSNVNP